MKTPHKGIQGEVGRSHEGGVTGIRERGPPLSRLLIKNESDLFIRGDMAMCRKNDVDFFHAGRLEQ